MSSIGPSTGVQSVFKLVLETTSEAVSCSKSCVVVTLSTLVLLESRAWEARKVALAALVRLTFSFFQQVLVAVRLSISNLSSISLVERSIATGRNYSREKLGRPSFYLS